MAAKKKAKKKSPAKKIQTRSTSKKTSVKKSPRKKVVSKRKVAAKVRKRPETQAGAPKRTRDSVFAEPRLTRTLSGDVTSEGLSTAESADSESVVELLEEGNTFEAGVVSGVERADDADEKEVRTREVPEDDVPEEYLDRDND